MTGAIIGDIAGSAFEFLNYKSKDFEFFGAGHYPTDDSLMTIAIAVALLRYDKLREKKMEASLFEEAKNAMLKLGDEYDEYMDTYGSKFREWLSSKNPEPYNSYGNGAAMRISPVGFVASSIEEAKALSEQVTSTTHNHPEGMKGAEAVAVCIVLAKQKKSKEEIRAYVNEHYYKLNFTIDEIRPTYKFDVSCQNSVPQAIEAFLESESFEDAIRTAVSLGGDSDTIAAIAGGIAEAFYGVPDEMRKEALEALDDDDLRYVVEAFEKRYQNAH